MSSLSNIDLQPLTNEDIKNMTLDELNKTYEKFKVYLEESVASHTTNENMINRFIDEPGMEHLIDMSIKASATESEIELIRCKMTQIRNEVIARGSYVY